MDVDSGSEIDNCLLDPTQSEFLVLQPEERPETITDEDSDLDETGNPSFRKRLSNPDQ